MIASLPRDLHAELAMIDENLMRSEYTPAQQAAAVARRKKIYEELHPETRQHGNIGPDRQFVATGKMSFAETTAAATGKDRRTIERAAKRGRVLGEDIDDIAGTSLDNGQELDTLCTQRRGTEEIERAIKWTICPHGFRSLHCCNVRSHRESGERKFCAHQRGKVQQTQNLRLLNLHLKLPARAAAASK